MGLRSSLKAGHQSTQISHECEESTSRRHQAKLPFWHLKRPSFLPKAWRNRSEFGFKRMNADIFALHIGAAIERQKAERSTKHLEASAHPDSAVHHLICYSAESLLWRPVTHWERSTTINCRRQSGWRPFYCQYCSDRGATVRSSHSRQCHFNG